MFVERFVAWSRRPTMYVVAAMLTAVAVIGSTYTGKKNVAASPTPTTSAFVEIDEPLDESTSTSMSDVTSMSSTEPDAEPNGTGATANPASTDGPTSTEPDITPTSEVPAPATTSTPTDSTASTEATAIATTTAAAAGVLASAGAQAQPSADLIAEVDRTGDEPNPGALFPGRPDRRAKDQERLVGPDQQPARLSGFSAWVVSPTLAEVGPDGAGGPFVKVIVRLVNRDDGPQDIADDQWTLLRPDGFGTTTVYATPVLVSGNELAANSEVFAELWFTALVSGRYWLSFRPDEGSPRGVWGLDVSLPQATTTTVARNGASSEPSN
jgi:hypothetical protein